VDGGHELVVRTEGYLSNNRAVVFQFLNVNASKVRSTKDGELSGVSNLALTSATLADYTLGAQYTAGKSRLDPVLCGGFSILEREVVIGVSRLDVFASGVEAISRHVEGRVLSAASLGVVGSSSKDFLSTLLQVLNGTLSQVGIVTNKVDGQTVSGIHIVLVTGIGGDEGSERHDVLGEGSCLVGADDSHRTKGLNSREGTDNGILGSHDLDSVGVGKSNDGLKTLGNHGNCANKGNVDGAKHFTLEGVGVEVGSEEGGETHGTDGNEEDLGHHINLLQNVGLDVISLVHETVDGTNLSEISGGDDNSNTLSLSNKGSCCVV